MVYVKMASNTTSSTPHSSTMIFERIQGGSTPRVLWSTEKVDELITHFRAHPCLYNRKIRAYNDKSLRLDALRAIAREMHISCDDVYRKIVNLRSQFRREKHREMRFASMGNPEEALSQIKWIHYKQLKFLDEFVTLRNPRTDYMQYSPTTNGFGDFDETLEEDVEYESIDVDEYKVGFDDGANERTIDLIDGESPNNEQQIHNGNYDFHRQSPSQERGTKRPRTDLKIHQDLHERHQYPDFSNSTERSQHQQQPVQNAHTSNRESEQVDTSQSALMQKASSHIQKALSCFEKSGGNSKCPRRCDCEDDDDMIFARYIASELRQLPNGETKRHVKHQIQNLIYGAHCKPHTIPS